ncbi:MAG: exodeoxyribonuclease VII small subunit [Planctomycetaceae bacterium]|nr:exodeoxyribonuclease VII small subunit [Planctomycetaceae bacterium]|tara:strand:- start:213 stop:578 length:366 start_codon:yes stop_codon:yes gene_type:complete
MDSNPAGGKGQPMGKKKPQQELTFEQALEGLEEIVAQLENGQLGLSEALECYQQGVGLLKHCHEALAGAERKIELLTGVDTDGNPITEEFEDEQSTLQEKQASRSRRRSAGEDIDESGDLF